MGELYLLPGMELLGVLLGELGGVLRQAVEESSWSLATEAVQLVLASLWSRLPDVPVQEAAEGIIRGFDVEARARTEAMAREGVNTSAPMPASGPPVGDAADPEAQPEVPAEEAVAGQ